MRRAALYIMMAFAALMTAVAASDAQEPVIYDYRVINTFPHDTDAFTQGLFFHDGELYESTGQYGESSVRKVEIESGEVALKTDLPAYIFGEGATSWNDKIISLTWRAGEGYVFDRENLELKKKFAYDGEGWGLTHDGERLILSDGTAVLRFLDPEALVETGQMTVTYKGKAIGNLNELEWVEGDIFANVWQKNYILRISPDTGAVTGVIDLRGLLPAEDFVRGRTDVLNGIAYDEETKRLFVTGKYWPTLFEIELVERKL